MFQFKVIKQFSEFCSNHDEITFFFIVGNIWLGQIKDGKQMHQDLETHFALYIALNKLYIATLIENNLIIEKELEEVVIKSITDVGD